MPRTWLRQCGLALHVCPDHKELVVLDVAVRQEVVKLALAVLLLAGLKLGVQDQQPVAVLVLNGHPGA